MHFFGIFVLTTVHRESLFEASEDSQVASSPETRDDITSGLQNLQLDHEKSLKKDDKRKRRDSLIESGADGMVVFETSIASARTGATENSRSSNGSKSSKKYSLFRKPSEVSDDDIEELPRVEEGMKPTENEHDVIIFIQMALHPMTCKNYLAPRVRHFYP